MQRLVAAKRLDRSWLRRPGAAVSGDVTMAIGVAIGREGIFSNKEIGWRN
jgi:hypothetical protein